MLVLIGWLVVLLDKASPSTSNILSSLSDLDFHRIREGHAQHSSERDDSSFLPTLSLTRQLLGAGYHRELRVNIKLQGSKGYSDKVLLVENITCDMYIDLDQVGTEAHPCSSEGGGAGNEPTGQHPCWVTCVAGCTSPKGAEKEVNVAYYMNVKRSEFPSDCVFVSQFRLHP